MPRLPVLAPPPPGTRVLALAAHPDDLEGSCSNTLLWLLRAGASITCAFSTGGEYGLTKRWAHFYLSHFGNEGETVREVLQRFYGYPLRQVRQGEMRGAAAAYRARVPESQDLAICWLGEVDGHVRVTRAFQRVIRSLLDEVHPQVVLLADPYLSCDWHLDHIRTGYAGIQAVRGMPEQDRPEHVLAYFTHQANVVIPYEPRSDAFEIFRVHQSQVSPQVRGWAAGFQLHLLHFALRAAHLNNVRKSGRWGEGFRLLPYPYCAPPRPTHLWRRVKYALLRHAVPPLPPERYIV